MRGRFNIFYRPLTFQNNSVFIRVDKSCFPHIKEEKTQIPRAVLVSELCVHLF